VFEQYYCSVQRHAITAMNAPNSNAVPCYADVCIGFVIKSYSSSNDSQPWSAYNSFQLSASLKTGLAIGDTCRVVYIRALLSYMTTTFENINYQYVNIVCCDLRLRECLRIHLSSKTVIQSKGGVESKNFASMQIT